MNLLKKSILHSLFISLLCANISNVHASDASIDIPKDSSFVYSLKLSVAIAFAASLIKYACTEPNNNPIRYDLEKAKQALKEIKDGMNIQENLETLANFTRHFILDGIIGHGTKKRSIRIDPDDPKKILVHPGAKAKGLYGYIQGYHKGIFAMGSFIVALSTFLKKGDSGWQDIQNFVFHPFRFLNGDFNKQNLNDVAKLTLAVKQLTEAVNNKV